jgi:hypothetical protein
MAHTTVLSMSSDFRVVIIDVKLKCMSEKVTASNIPTSAPAKLLEQNF